MSILQIKNLSFTYAGQNTPALKNISMELEDGSFTVLCGKTGSGKSTLLSLLKRETAPVGTLDGELLFDGKPLSALTDRESVAAFGMVHQNPQVQIICDKVWHELAFTLESLGTDSTLIRRRCGEVSTFLGIDRLFNRQTDELSGGEQQLVCLAAALSTNPRILLLDEVLSRLDPVAAADLISVLMRINRELGVTVLMCEHRLEELASVADRLIVLDKGELFWQGSPRELDKMPYPSPVEQNLPMASRIFRQMGSDGVIPLNTAEGRKLFRNLTPKNASGLHHQTDFISDNKKNTAVLTANGLYFGYDSLVLRDTAITLNKGEHYALLGGNGSGKSTLLYLLAGSCKAQRGKIKCNGRVVLLPQNPLNILGEDSVAEELGAELIERLGLGDLRDKNPMDLSGGQQQLLAFGKAIERQCDVLLLDEPTKGLDGACRQLVGELIMEQTATGKTVLTVSHDMEFCADFADRCALMFDGGIISEGDTHTFFKDNICYTTSVCKMTDGKAVSIYEL
jgi:energy-coupling factor transport system ATP-binding protein